MYLLDDEVLVAYIDGQLEDDVARQVEAALLENPIAQAKIRKLKDTSSILKQPFDQLLNTPLSPDFANTIMSKKVVTMPDKRLQIALASAFVTVLFFLGIGTGYIYNNYQQQTIQKSQADSWIQAVVDYQILYGRQTLENPAPALQEVNQTRQRLGEILGNDLLIPDLMGEGLLFKRGQVLEFRGNPVIQLAYLPEQGKPVAYCITKINTNNQALVQGSSKGLSYLHWQKDGYGYILVGDIPEKKLYSLHKIITKDSV